MPAAAAPAPAGLTSAEARRRLAQHGPNAVAVVEPPPLWRRAVRQFRSPLVYILLFALAFDLATWIYGGAREWPAGSLVIALVLLFNAGLGVVQEHRSERALAQLRELSAPKAWVLRDGRLARIASAGIVPGDVIRLDEGERVPADARLAEARGLLLDESVLTGESLPVERAPGEEVLSGTLAVRGSALAEVVRTGARSAMGRLAELVARLETGRTPLERRLDAFGRRVAAWVLALAAALVAAGLLAEGLGRLGQVLLFAVALAVSAVPEGMPAVVALTLALGVQRMARRHAVVRRLQAVEALGSVSVIATDKTGTLTENRLFVRSLDAVDEAEALVALVVANDADPETGAGDPLDRALLDFARGRGIDPAALRSRLPAVGARPFHADWKFVRTTALRDGARASWLKGAAEVILERSALAPAERERWLARAEARAAEGFRVLGVAASEGEAERDLRFLGIVSLWDPPRAEVARAVRRAQEAGVRVVMVTGDHPATARTVAASIGMEGADAGVLTGAELASLEPDGLREALRCASVFARVTPEQKLAVVEALRGAGEVVAVTGDGVNDAPALKRSDVGIAMGRRGSDVAREVSDLVLLDDDFATIVAAIEEGRGIYANIQKFIRFLFSTNAAELVLVVAGSLGAFALDLRDASGALLLPLTAVQILWINFLSDGPPALALGVDSNPGVMRERPRPAASPLLDRPSLRFVVTTGLLKAAVAGALLLGLPLAGVALDATQSSVFLFTGLAQLAFAYPARRLSGPTGPNPVLHGAVLLAAAAQLATVLVAPLRDALGLVPLGALPWATVVAAVALTWLGAEASGLLLGRHGPGSPSASRGPGA
jgi:Ca2+-transporting ATPase